MRLVLSALVVAFAAVGYIAVGSQQVANPTTAGIITGIVVERRRDSVSPGPPSNFEPGRPSCARQSRMAAARFVSRT